VIPEATAMVCAQVIGNHVTITVAGQSGNFQLNVMLPVVAHNLLESDRAAVERVATPRGQGNPWLHGAAPTTSPKR